MSGAINYFDVDEKTQADLTQACEQHLVATGDTGVRILKLQRVTGEFNGWQAQFESDAGAAVLNITPARAGGYDICEPDADQPTAPQPAPLRMKP